MKILFSLKEHHLFSTIKFILNNQKKPKKVKIISFCILFVLFSASIAYLYYQNSNIYLIIFLVIFYAVFLFLFLKFIDYCFEKFIRKYIKKLFWPYLKSIFFWDFRKSNNFFSAKLRFRVENKKGTDSWYNWWKKLYFSSFEKRFCFIYTKIWIIWKRFIWTAKAFNFKLKIL